MAFVSSSVKQRRLFSAVRLQALSVLENTSWRGVGRSGQALQDAPDSQCEHGVCWHKEGVQREKASGSCFHCSRAAGEAVCT